MNLFFSVIVLFIYWQKYEGGWFLLYILFVYLFIDF